MSKDNEFKSLMHEITHKIIEVAFLMRVAKTRRHIDGNELPYGARNRLVSAVSEVLDVLSDGDECGYVDSSMDRLTQAIIQLEDARGCVDQEMDITGRTELLEEAEGRIRRARDGIVMVQRDHAMMFANRLPIPALR